MDIFVATKDDRGTKVEDDSGDEQDPEPKCRCHVLEGTASLRKKTSAVCVGIYSFAIVDCYGFIHINTNGTW